MVGRGKIQKVSQNFWTHVFRSNEPKASGDKKQILYYTRWWKYTRHQNSQSNPESENKVGKKMP